MNSSNDGAAAAAAVGAFFLIYFLFIAALCVFTGYLYWKIAQKAGYPGAMSLLMFVPLANIIVMILFAFQKWPVEQELERLRGGYSPPQWPSPPTGQPPPASG